MHRRSVPALAAMVAAAGAAHAQCSYFVPYVPDFDQKRTSALPGDGGMYCVPTSVTNWFAYFANRGIPQAAGLDGPRSWQSNSNYNLVSQNIGAMGNLMGTSTSSGTTGNNGLWGAWLYSLAFTQGKVVVVHYWCGDGDCPTPQSMCYAASQGGFVAACYGRYDTDSTAHYTRTGGHCLSINGVDSQGGGLPGVIHYRDPASDDYNTTQSTFVTHDVSVQPMPGFFRGQGGGSYSFDIRYQVLTGTSTKFLDGWYVLYPVVCLTAFTNGTLHVIRPIRMQANLPETQIFNIPAGIGALRGVIQHPTYLERVYYITGPAIAGGPTRLERLDAISSQSMEQAQGTDFHHLEFNRFGDLYVCDGSVLKMFNAKVNPATLVTSMNLGTTPRALAYDDSTDTICFVTPPGGVPSRLVRYDRALTGLQSAANLPTGVNPAGAMTMGFNRNGEIFLAGDGTPAFYQMSQTGTTLNLLRTTTLGTGDHPAGLNVNDADHVLFSSNGVLREYEPDPNGRYIPSPGSLFAGRPAGPFNVLLRSRTNHLRTLHEGPGYANLVNPEIAPGRPDCYANCDGSSTPPVLNVNDFVCYQNLFATGNIEANCDQSTTPPVLNVNDFICFQTLFARGCP